MIALVFRTGTELPRPCFALQSQARTGGDGSPRAGARVGVEAAGDLALHDGRQIAARPPHEPITGVARAARSPADDGRAAGGRPHSSGPARAGLDAPARHHGQAPAGRPARRRVHQAAVSLQQPSTAHVIMTLARRPRRAQPLLEHSQVKNS
jgi:hypothetical protein